MELELKSSPFRRALKLVHTNGDIITYRNKIRYRARNTDKYHVVKDSETLLTIAFKYYGNDKYWWVIGDVNDITNPFKLELGKNLLIPPLENLGL